MQYLIVTSVERESIRRRCQSLVRLCLTSVKASTPHRPRLHPQAQGTGVLRAINKIQGRIVHKEQYPGAAGIRACLLLVLWFAPQLFWKLRRADFRREFGWAAESNLEAIAGLAKRIKYVPLFRWIWFRWAEATCYLHGHKPVNYWTGWKSAIRCDRCGEMNRPTLADWLEYMQRERDEWFPGEPDPSFDEVPF